MANQNSPSRARDERGEAPVAYVVGVAGVFALVALGVVIVSERVWFEPFRPVVLITGAAAAVVGLLFVVMVAIAEMRWWLVGRANRRNGHKRW